jgi:UDP-glucuronate decarboxylase
VQEDLEYINSVIDLEQIRGKSFLLIGSEGFLGNWFSDFFDHNNIEYLTYDISNGEDICEQIELKRCDYVINCAGIASPEKYMKKPVETLDVSYLGTKNVFDYCIRNNVESILLFSSSEVYGTPHKDSIPTKEEYVGCISTRTNRSCYDIGKQVLETLSYVYHSKYNIPVKVVRPFNFYGPHMGINDNRVLSNWMNNYLEDKKIVVYGNGNQTRTFCYVADGIAMCLSVLLNGEDGEIYNVGNPSPELSINELAKRFCDILGYQDMYDVQEYPDMYPSDEPLRRCPNIDKTVKKTGIRPKTSFENGLKNMLQYFKEKK